MWHQTQGRFLSNDKTVCGGVPPHRIAAARPASGSLTKVQNQFLLADRYSDQLVDPRATQSDTSERPQRTWNTRTQCSDVEVRSCRTPAAEGPGLKVIYSSPTHLAQHHITQLWLHHDF